MANSSYKGATDTRQLLIGQSKAQGRDQGVKSEVGKANLIKWGHNQKDKSHWCNALESR